MNPIIKTRIAMVHKPKMDIVLIKALMQKIKPSNLPVVSQLMN
jgi:hypothetical protein